MSSYIVTGGTVVEDDLTRYAKLKDPTNLYSMYNNIDRALNAIYRYQTSGNGSFKTAFYDFAAAQAADAGRIFNARDAQLAGRWKIADLTYERQTHVLSQAGWAVSGIIGVGQAVTTKSNGDYSDRDNEILRAGIITRSAINATLEVALLFANVQRWGQATERNVTIIANQGRLPDDPINQVEFVRPVVPIGANPGADADDEADPNVNVFLSPGRVGRVAGPNNNPPGDLPDVNNQNRLLDAEQYIHTQRLNRTKIGGLASTGFALNAIIGIGFAAKTLAVAKDADDEVGVVTAGLTITSLGFNGLANGAKAANAFYDIKMLNAPTAAKDALEASGRRMGVYGSVFGLINGLANMSTLAPSLDAAKTDEQKGIIAAEMALQLVGGIVQVMANYRLAMNLARGMTTTAATAGPALGAAAGALMLALSPLEIYALTQQTKYREKLLVLGREMGAAGYLGDTMLANIYGDKVDIEAGVMTGTTALAVIGIAVEVAALLGGAVTLGVSALVSVGTAIAGAILKGVQQDILEAMAHKYASKIVAQGGSRIFFDTNLEASYQQMIAHASTRDYLAEIQNQFDVDQVIGVTTTKLSATALELAAITRKTEGLRTATASIDTFVNGQAVAQEAVAIDAVGGRITLGGAAGQRQLLTFLTPLLTPGEEQRDRDKTSKKNFYTSLRIVYGGAGWSVTDGEADSIMDMRRVASRLYDAKGKLVREVALAINGGGGDDSLIAGVSATSFDGGAGSDAVTYVGLSAGSRVILTLDAEGGASVRKDLVGAEAYIEKPSVNKIPFGERLEKIEVRDISVKEITATVTDTLRGVERYTGSAGNDIMTGNVGNDYFDGGRGDDALSSGAGNDILVGGEGNDTLSGGAGNDILVDGEGNDSLDGGEGVDMLDYLNLPGQLGGISARLDSGGKSGKVVNKLTVSTNAIDTILDIENLRGTQRDDTITGNEENNVLWGVGGNDKISGMAGDDILIGGAGADTLDGGAGIDTVSFADDFSESTRFDASDGVTVNLTLGFATNSAGVRDILTGIENVVGSERSDTLQGTAEANQLVGMSFYDTISGMGGDDILTGGEHSDLLFGYQYPGWAVWRLITGNYKNYPGLDEYNQFTTWNMTAKPVDDGIDTADYSDQSGPIIAEMGTYLSFADGVTGKMHYVGEVWAVDEEWTSDLLYEIENLIGTPFDDEIGGDGGANQLEGGAGFDWISGGGGNDVLIGGAGSDALFGEAGDDWFIPDAVPAIDPLIEEKANPYNRIRGADMRLIGPPPMRPIAGATLAGDTMDGGAGSDTIDFATIVLPSGVTGVDVQLANDASLPALAGKYFARGYSGNITAPVAGVNYLSNIENVIGSVADDRIIGDAGANHLDGDTGNDTVNGGAGDDTVAGGLGNDLLDGGAGDDVVLGGVGDDTLAGGAGQDILLGGEGNDTLLGDADDAADYSDGPGGLNYGIWVELHTVDTQGYAKVYEQWSSASQQYSTTGYDRLQGIGNLTGTRQGDRLVGNASMNMLYGGAGDDYIDGAAGDDILDGGTGRDMLIGGAGDDLFLHDQAANAPASTDSDTIDGGLGMDTLDYRGLAAAWSLGVDLNLNSGPGTAPAAGRFAVRGFSGVLTALVAGMNYVSGIENVVGSLFGDSLIGDAANNVINGVDGNDLINGLAGDDLLTGGAGRDTVSGGDGADVFFQGLAEDGDVLDGGVGLDTLSFQDAVPAQAAGTATPGANLGVRVDMASGSVEKRPLTGTAPQFGIARISNIEIVIGSMVDDILQGDATDNYLFGIDGHDLIEGRDGEDVVDGGNGNDTLLAGLGNDTLNGGAGNDSLSGGDGNDMILQEIDRGNDTIDGGEGHDTLDYSITEFVEGQRASLGNVGIHANLGSRRVEKFHGTHASDPTGVDTLVSIESLVGTSLNDRITGNGASNVLSGGAGNDTILGAAGDDFLYGGAGADSIDGGEGDDLIVQDIAYVNDTIIGGAGMDTLDYGLTVFYDDTLPEMGTVGVQANLALGKVIKYRTVQVSYEDSISNIENLVGSALADLLTGDANSNSLKGGTSLDTLHGGAGDDLLSGDDDNDKLYGEGGADTLAGGQAADLLDGGDGDDTILQRLERVVDTIDGGAGQDLLDYSIAVFVEGSRTGLNDRGIVADLATGRVDKYEDASTDGFDVISNIEDLIGTGLHDRLNGNAQNNWLAGLDGNDTLWGRGGDDLLEGGHGNDTLVGNEGNDILAGATGNDLLVGDVGADRYRFERGSGTDLIQDSSAVAGEQDVISFGTGIVADELWFSRVGTNLQIRVLGSADHVTVENWYQSADKQVEVIETSDGKRLLAAQVQALVSAMAGLALPASAGAVPATVKTAINAAWQIDDAARFVSGTAGNDVLFGGAGSDILDGGSGSDTMRGGAGDDYFVQDIDASLDQLYGDAGSDTVEYRRTLGLKAGVIADLGTGRIDKLRAAPGVTASYDLVFEIENVIGSRFDDILRGNAGANGLDGSVGNDSLEGGAGNDTLIGGTTFDRPYGGSGNDTLVGGTGSDAYLFGVGFGQDVVRETSSLEGDLDYVMFEGGVMASQLWFRREGNGLQVSVIGTNDRVEISNWYAGAAFQIEEFRTESGILLGSEVESLVTAMSTLAPPPLGQTTLPAALSSRLNPVIMANWSG